MYKFVLGKNVCEAVILDRDIPVLSNWSFSSDLPPHETDRTLTEFYTDVIKTLVEANDKSEFKL